MGQFLRFAALIVAYNLFYRGARRQRLGEIRTALGEVHRQRVL